MTHPDTIRLAAALDALKDMTAEFRALDLPYGSKAYAKAISVLNQNQRGEEPPHERAQEVRTQIDAIWKSVADALTPSPRTRK